MSFDNWNEGWLCFEHNQKFCSACEPITVSFSTNNQWRGKTKKLIRDGRTYQTYNGQIVSPGKRWENAYANVDELFEYLTVAGGTIGPELIETEDGTKSEATFKSHQVVLVDIDDGMTIEHLAENDTYQQYAAGFYTTPSHTEQHHKFRIIFLLEEPITKVNDLRRLYTGLINIFGGDEACKDGARMFFGTINAARRSFDSSKRLPQSKVTALIKQVEMRERIELESAHSDYEPPTDENKQRMLELLKRCFCGEYHMWFRIGAAMKHSGFTVDDFIDVSIGHLMIKKTVGDCKQVWNGIKSSRGKQATYGTLVWFVKKKLGVDVTVEGDEESFIETFLEERRQKRLEPNDFKDELVEIEQESARPFTREERANLLKKHCLRRHDDVTLLYAFEGFGKSYFAHIMVTEQKSKVVFACSSNEQASEQAESFRSYGHKVQFIPGRNFLLETKYGVRPIYNKQTHPWDTDTLNKVQTIKEICKKLKISELEAELIWDETKPEHPNFEQHDIICTTIARTQVWGRRQKENAKVYFNGKITLPSSGDRIVPKGAYVFYDDPDAKYFLEIVRWDKKWQDAKIDGRPIEVVQRNGRDYFLRPVSYKLGFGLYDARLVFTTTERMIEKLVETLYPDVYKPPLIPEQKMETGNIIMIKTPLTREKVDGFVPVIARRVQKEMNTIGRPTVEYIGNGTGHIHNLVSSKGKNSFTNVDTIIKVSYPNPLEVLLYLDALEWENSYGNLVAQVLSCDAMQQAIGRNSGYRWSDQPDSERRSCVVLIDPQLLKPVYKMMRYQAKSFDPSAIVGRKEDWTDLKTCIGWFLKNFDVYVQRGVGKERVAFINDIKAVIVEAPIANRRVMKSRIEKAIQHKMKSIKDEKLAARLEEILLFLT